MRIPGINSLFSSRVAAAVGSTGAPQSFGAVLAETIAEPAEQQPVDLTAVQTAAAPAESAQTATVSGLSAEDLAVLTRLQQAMQAAGTPAPRVFVSHTGVATTIGSPASTADPIDPAQGSAVTDYALQFQGTPYVWGGEDLRNGVDCSGFTQSVYKEFGVDLPRTAYQQSKVGQEVDWDDLQPGDLLFFKTADYAPVTHVAMYLGNNKIVHASSSHDEVTVTDLSSYFRQRFVTARRVQ